MATRKPTKCKGSGKVLLGSKRKCPGCGKAFPFRRTAPIHNNGYITYGK